MKKYKLILMVCVMIAGLFLLVGCPAAEEEAQEVGVGDDPMIVRIAHSVRPGAPRDLGAWAMKEYVEAALPGVFDVQIFPAAQLGPGPEQIQGLQAGTLEICINPGAFLGGFEPLTGIMDVPGLLPPDISQIRELLTGPAGDALRNVTVPIGIYILDIWHDGFCHFASNTAIRSVEDIQGQRFRVMPSPIRIATIEALGGVPINMAWGDTYNALMTGAVDGQENPIDNMTDAKLHEVQQYLTITYHGSLDQFIMSSHSWWENLSDEHQDVWRRAVVVGRETSEAAKLTNTDLAYELFEEAGAEIIIFDEAERARMIEALAPVRNVYADLSPEAAELLALFESEIARITGQ